MDLSAIFREFITLFVVIDPIGSVPVFLFATKYVPRTLHRRFAIRAVAVASAVLIGFLLFGQFVLEAMGLRLGSFQIAGGIVLFIFAMTMIFGESKPQREIEEAERDHLEGAVFPLAIPSIASPGAMLGVVVLTDNHQNSFGAQMITAAALLVVLAITLGLLLVATKVYKYIGNTGANIISRVMGMLLAAVAVDAILGGMDVMGLATVVGGAGEMLSGNR
ncbi:MarC family protein [Paracoccus albus]|uniref:MarC family protein n=1 Tax=Paracoccus albus TaxID=3017784 RepID=UPI0022F0FCF0|nr:MarC family protein [Paracoccus albus]WBU59469.1 MarC family protein [Paracoccus albus]